MAKEAMVSIDISRAAEIVETLERANVKVGVALWMFLSEYEDWRFVVAARQFDSPDPREAYRLFHDSLTAAGLKPQEIPAVLILPTADPFIRELRRIFGKAKSVEGMRLGGQEIGGRFVEDAYAYRIS